MSLTQLTRILGLLALGCSAATPGARPHDMSAENHEAAAKAHQQASEEHAAEYNPEAREARERCALSPKAVRNACWSSVRNPTAIHARQAAAHRRHAADHRAASGALRDAEALACAGLGQDDRDISPFAHREDIAGVEPLREPSNNPKIRGTRTVGAVVTLRAVQGMTAEWLQRIVDCHIARSSALGHVVPEMPYCPLVPKGVSATVSPARGGFRISICAEDEAGGREVLARAERLTQ